MHLLLEQVDVLALVLLLGKRQLRLVNRLAQLHQARQAHLEHWKAIYTTKTDAAYIVCLESGNKLTKVFNERNG